MDTSPPPSASSASSDQLVAILSSLRDRFARYKSHCSSAEADSAAKKRYDAALTFQTHGFCWDQALADVDLALSAFRAGGAAPLSISAPTTPTP